MVLEDSNPRMFMDRGQQRSLEFPSCKIARVHNAVHGVSPLTAQIERAAFCPGKARADRDQVANALGSLVDQDADRIFMAKAGACNKRIPHVRRERIRTTDDTCDAALRVVRV